MFAKRSRENVRAGRLPNTRRPARSGVWVLAVAIAGSSMAFIDSSAVNVALPSIQRDLHADAGGLQWVIEGYALFLSALILVGGSLGDLFGRRRVFITGIAIFAAASLACAASGSIAMLVASRCIQGVGGALATPGSLALISANFGTAERGRAIGTWSGFAAITAAIGPLLGGWLAQTASWRDVFLINVPLAAFTIGAALLRVPESHDRDAGRAIDFGGAALVTAALGALTFGLIRLQDSNYDRIGMASVGSGLLLVAMFAFWETKARAPMMPLQIFRNATFSGANAYTFFLYGALGGSFYFVPFDLQNVLGYSPAAAGASMLPFIIIMFVFSRWSGGLVNRIGARSPLIAGAVLAGFGFLAYARAGAGGSYWLTFFPASVILGFGGALFVAPLTTAVMEAIPSEHAGMASGINNAVSRVASLLAIAALGIVLATTFYRDFDRRIAGLNVSAASAHTLAAQRATLGTGRPLSGLVEPDRSPIDAAVAAAYTAAFARTMLISALAAWFAALIAGFALTARNPSAEP